ncbi:hypothetical protein GCM10009715_03720 [Paeniglutamicibacter psychrophenolicus]|uniref:Uncharacterized protein n=1 Tax=Paeniglutamicibacter psychrophenolicus TaxID=257454 RepID=A0ABS4WD91_9MICC|nr:hypothetical protein [Paeniglutamicibacter psychrophenolicus]MBP2374174.1 hypothetical protein [Paeniglutamicibacter psychrophenolicus]
MPASDFFIAASGILGTGQFFAGPLELEAIGFGDGFAVGLGDTLGEEVEDVAVGVEGEIVGSTGSALPPHPAAASRSAPELKTTMTFLVFANMPLAYDSVGVN